MGHRPEAGAAVASVALASLALALVLAVAIAVVGGILTARAAASTAADAAALAAAPATFPSLGLGSPGEAAAEAAAANGAELLSCLCSLDRSWATRRSVVEVAVILELPVVGTIAVEAVSSAEFRPVALVRS